MQNNAHLWKRVDSNMAQVIRGFLNEHPVRIASLAKALGLEVTKVVLEPQISGEIRPSETAESGFKIRVNRHEKKARQRFTVAHELAHFLLHSDRIGAGVTDSVLYRSGLPEIIEFEANRLAADLLMPRDHVLSALDELGGIPTEEVAEQLAERFEVSKPAMKIRLGLS